MPTLRAHRPQLRCKHVQKRNLHGAGEPCGAQLLQVIPAPVFASNVGAYQLRRDRPDVRLVVDMVMLKMVERLHGLPLRSLARLYARRSPRNRVNRLVVLGHLPRSEPAQHMRLPTTGMITHARAHPPKREIARVVRQQSCSAALICASVRSC